MIKLLPILLLLVGCGGSTSLEPTANATAAPTGAVYSNTVYASRDSELQSLVDAGGEIKLGCGTYEGSVITIRSGISLVGSGACTKIPSIQALGDVRTYHITVSNLVIDGAIDGYRNIGIDFRNVSNARLNDIIIKNVNYGVLFAYGSYYNAMTDLIIDANLGCYEIVEVANENVITRGRCQGSNGTARIGIGAKITNSNSVKIFGTSFENLEVAIQIDARGTSIYSPRCENMDICIDILPTASQTTIISPYYSSVGIKINSNGTSIKNIGF